MSRGPTEQAVVRVNLAGAPLALRLEFSTGQLSAVCWDGGADVAARPAPPAMLEPWLAWFEGYADATPTAMDTLPLASPQTPFLARLQAALWGIPFGETRTYGELAHELGSAPRAVGQALARNPVPIVVPCHRVLAARGLGGFSGERRGRPMAIKEQLLRHEGVTHVLA